MRSWRAPANRTIPARVRSIAATMFTMALVAVAVVPANGASPAPDPFPTVETWIDAAPGSFVLVPGGVTHDFENRGDVRAGLLNFSPGVFEPEMRGIAEWFAENPPGHA